MYSIIINVLALHFVKIPYDQGANKKGSRFAPDFIASLVTFRPDNIKKVEPAENMKTMMQYGHKYVYDSLKSKHSTITIGGDHTISIASVFASNDFCCEKNEKMGVLWCDAHADFNTMESSPSKNLHGMPVAALCKHTLQDIIPEANALEPNQFAFFGTRDVDDLEMKRFQKYNMKLVENLSEIGEWIRLFDKIHISLDIDFFDPSIVSAVNTPVSHGKSFDDFKQYTGEELEFFMISNKYFNSSPMKKNYYR